MMLACLYDWEDRLWYRDGTTLSVAVPSVGGPYPSRIVHFVSIWLACAFLSMLQGILLMLHSCISDIGSSQMASCAELRQMAGRQCSRWCFARTAEKKLLVELTRSPRAARSILQVLMTGMTSFSPCA